MIGFAARARRRCASTSAWRAIAALDGQIPADGADSASSPSSPASCAPRPTGSRAARPGRAGGRWRAAQGRDAGARFRSAPWSMAYQPAMDELAPGWRRTCSRPSSSRIVARRIKAFRRDGAPKDMAANLAALSLLTTGLRPRRPGQEAADWPDRPAARLYHQVGARFGFDRLRAAAGSLTPPTASSGWRCGG